MGYAANISISDAAVRDLCRRWKIKRLALFGSVLRDDFTADSDIDILVAFRDHAAWSLWDWIEMTDEMRTLFGRDVDVFEESGLTNPFRRRKILSTREILYEG
jgi:predicted nucleotidyltransferase